MLTFEARMIYKHFAEGAQIQMHCISSKMIFKYFRMAVLPIRNISIQKIWLGDCGRIY